MKRRLVSILTVALNLAMLSVVVLTTMAAEVSRMTKEELKSKLGTPDAVIIDVRVGRDWKASEMKIKGAVRGDPQDLESWAKKYSKDKTLVFYCA
ncbi:MAG: hypothetical protein KAQ81_16670 [Deltaproteobacteria bacterium]|jgi:hypothetical protein|nr:hypothetical protein [Deltaproteobacteria bacterium]MCK5257666.1 hypothetical protein [Deltaproteobacteria bacterium]